LSFPVCTAFGLQAFFPLLSREREDMNKNELIAKVAKDTRLTRGEAGEAIEATIENIMRALRQGDDVRLIGFGVFTVTRRKAGEARNPQTGKAIRLPASKRAKFKAGKLLKEAVNG
jgi:DNA-binding protein HU-beta